MNYQVEYWRNDNKAWIFHSAPAEGRTPEEALASWIYLRDQHSQRFRLTPLGDSVILTVAPLVEKEPVKAL